MLRDLTGGGMDRIAGHFRRFTGRMHIKPGGAHCSEIALARSISAAGP